MKRLAATICLTIAVFLGSVGAGYALPYCPSDQNQYYDNCYGTYTSASGARYVGEFKENKKHGQGNYTWPDGAKYVGEWKDGKEDGQATYTTVTGDKYVGNFWDGRKNGQGTFTFANGRILEGIWKDGKFQYAQKVTPRS